MLQGYVQEGAYRVSDTYWIWIRVRYAKDTYRRSIRILIISRILDTWADMYRPYGIRPGPITESHILCPRRPSQRCPHSCTPARPRLALQHRAVTAHPPLAARRRPYSPAASDEPPPHAHLVLTSPPPAGLVRSGRTDGDPRASG